MKNKEKKNEKSREDRKKLIFNTLVFVFLFISFLNYFQHFKGRDIYWLMQEQAIIKMTNVGRQWNSTRLH